MLIYISREKSGEPGVGWRVFIYLLPEAFGAHLLLAMILGITGGIGCGKSTAARHFEKQGFRRLDMDELVREKALTSPEVVSALRGRFGSGVVDSDGNVDRRALGGFVFKDDVDRIWLEQLTHPIVFSLTRSALAENRSADWAVEVPLLFEQSLENWFDFTLCVACAASQQLVRLEQRGMNRALAGQRISKQLPLARKIELADFVLWNDGSVEFLQEQVDRLVDSLRSAPLSSPSRPASTLTP